MVRSAERPMGDQGTARLQQPGDAVNLGDVESLFEGELGQNGRQTAREHGLARARRTNEQDVMRAGGRDLQSPLREPLTTNLQEVYVGLRGASDSSRLRGR